VRGGSFSDGRAGDPPDHPTTSWKAEKATQTASQHQRQHTWNIVNYRGARHANTSYKRRQITLQKINRSHHTSTLGLNFSPTTPTPGANLGGTTLMGH
jgi:hypothetical protein